MVPQARSEATRQKIRNAGIDLFSEVGYAAPGLGEIIERVGMTKGALYHHFDSKDPLVTAIIEQGTNLTLERSATCANHPRLHSRTSSTTSSSSQTSLSPTKRPAQLKQLTCGLAEFNSAASQVWNSRLDAMTTQARRASAEGDLREGSDPYVVSESVLNAMLGAQLLAKTADGNDHSKRLRTR